MEKGILGARRRGLVVDLMAGYAGLGFWATVAPPGLTSPVVLAVARFTSKGQAVSWGLAVCPKVTRAGGA